MYSLTGKLIVKNDTEQIKDTFKKREFVLTDEDARYPQEIMFQLVQDKVDLIDPYQINDQIKVNFNIRGRRWVNPKTDQTKFFVSLDAWRIEKAEAEAPGSDLPPLPDSEPANINSDSSGSDDSDDLPF